MSKLYCNEMIRTTEGMKKVDIQKFLESKDDIVVVGLTINENIDRDETIVIISYKNTFYRPS